MARTSTQRSKSHGGLLAAVILCLVASPRPVGGELDSDRALKVKAGYLINFCKFTHWPEGTFEGPNQVLQIAIAADSALARVLEVAVNGKSVNGRPLAVVRLDPPGVSETLSSGTSKSGRAIHVLYVAAGVESEWPTIQAALVGKSVLTVSDLPDFVGVGGMLGLTLHDGRITFEVGVKAARDHGLQLDARLLSLAARVEGKDQ